MSTAKMSALETVHTVSSYTPPAHSGCVCVYLSLTLSLSGLVCCYAAAVDGGAVVVKEVRNVNNAIMLSSPFGNAMAVFYVKNVVMAWNESDEHIMDKICSILWLDKWIMGEELSCQAGRVQWAEQII